MADRRPDAEVGCKPRVGLNELSSRWVEIAIEGNVHRMPIALPIEPCEGVNEGINWPPFGKIAKMGDLIGRFTWAFGLGSSRPRLVKIGI